MEDKSRRTIPELGQVFESSAQEDLAKRIVSRAKKMGVEGELLRGRTFEFNGKTRPVRPGDKGFRVNFGEDEYARERLFNPESSK